MMNNENRFEVLRPKVRDSKAAKERLNSRLLPKVQHDLEASAKFYEPGEELSLAINTALAVEAPLLLTGDPGTGKTQVAYYLSDYFDIDLFSYQVRSVSTVEDMKYDFDAVGYLRYAEHGDEEKTSSHKKTTRTSFLTENALWKAFEHPDVSVLLIDEIDKAPRDFPNDLLQELDQYEFKHPFENRIIKATQHPIVIITSNAERRLPDAFLRRCIYHHIDLTPELVSGAVKARTEQDFPHLDEAFIAQAELCFWEIFNHELINRKPSTAELLVWLSVLSAQGATIDKLDEYNLKELPALGALVKDKDDLARLNDAS